MRIPPPSDTWARNMSAGSSLVLEVATGCWEDMTEGLGGVALVIGNVSAVSRSANADALE